MQEYKVKLKDPHPNQWKVIDCICRFIVLMCGRRWGKSVVSQELAINTAIDGLKVAYMTPTLKLARKFFKTYQNAISPGLAKFNKQDLTIEFITSGSIQFFTGENVDSVRGLDFDLFIIDEASYITDLQKAWTQAIRATLTDRRGKAVFLSTPKGQNDFYHFSLKEKKDPGTWKTFKFTTYDNPYIPKDEIDAAAKELPEAVFRQEYLADPMENADNPFGNKFITVAIRPISDKAPVCYGIDLAKYEDYTVITGLDEDGNVCYFDRFQKSWKETLSAISLLENLPICIDATGNGDPIAEALQEDRDNVEGFKFTETSRQQLLVALAVAIQQGLIGFPDGPIVSELRLFEFVYTNRGIKYAAPDAFHDDCVMSLALARRAWIEASKYADYDII